MVTLRSRPRHSAARKSSAAKSTATAKPWLAGGLVFAVLGLAVDFQGLQDWLTTEPAIQSSRCEAIVQADTLLSRKQLAEFLTIPERDTKARVREVVAEPYCRMPQLNVRSGVVAEREVYPLAFDPSTQLVILYEGEEYAGYRFSFE